MTMQGGNLPFFQRAVNHVKLNAQMQDILSKVAQCEAADKLIRVTDAHTKAQKMAYSNGMPNWEFLFTEDDK